MALTTRDNRAAAIVPFLPIGRVFPNPDAGAEDAADRQQSAQSYRLAATAVSIPAILGDLTTLWCLYFQPAVHVGHAVGAAGVYDDTTLARRSVDTDALGYDSEQDLNTALAKYIDTEL